MGELKSPGGTGPVAIFEFRVTVNSPGIVDLHLLVLWDWWQYV
jgi:hypothetical protein